MKYLPAEGAVREGGHFVQKLGETDIARLHPPPAHLYRGPHGQVGSRGLHSPPETVPRDPPATIEPAELLVREVPLASQETLGLVDRAVKGEILKPLQGILRDKAMNGSLGR
jgi:hypothetical protein